jgi:CRP/FNR family transcriptional regulator, putaive post-exponential-phase nitrogen-starvation regulator
MKILKKRRLFMPEELSFKENELEYYIKKFNINSFVNDRLLSQMKIFHFEAYDTVMTENTIIEYLYFLVDGHLKCAHYNSNGTLAVVAMMHPFSVLGDVEIISNDLTLTSVVTTGCSTVLGIPISIVRNEGLNDPIFLKMICEELVKKLNSSTSLRLGHLIPVISRLALYILSRPGAIEGKVIVLPEKEALASMLNTTYRHLNRVIKELKEENTIGDGYPGVKIKNIMNLQKLID